MAAYVSSYSIVKCIEHNVYLNLKAVRENLPLERIRDLSMGNNFIRPRLCVKSFTVIRSAAIPIIPVIPINVAPLDCETISNNCARDYRLFNVYIYIRVRAHIGVAVVFKEQ